MSEPEDRPFSSPDAARRAATNDAEAFAAAEAPRITVGDIRDLGPVVYLIERIAAKAIGAERMNLFATLGRTKRTFLAWLPYSGALMPFGSLARRDTEIVIVRVAAARSSVYELGHHRRLAHRAGVHPEVVDALIAGESATVFDEHTANLVAAVDEILANRQVTAETWAKLATELSERQLVEFVMLVTQYDGLATTIAVLGIEPEHG